jgi:hypothetical protein
MISLRYSTVELTVITKSLEEVAFWDTKNSSFINMPELNCKLLTDYVYLDNDERKKFAESKHEYLIETIQEYKTIIDSNTDIQDNKVNNILYFHHMCKQLTWTVRFIHNNSDKKNILDWNNFNYIDPMAIESIGIEFDGRPREDFKNYNYYTYVQPYEKGYSSLMENIFLYAFSLYPSLLQPSGAVNLDKLNNISIVLKLNNNTIQKINGREIILSWNTFSKSYNILRIMSGLAGLAFFGTSNTTI